MSKTLDRIRKLLALANDSGASTNEAEVAGNLAAKLMEAAGLSESDVTDSVVDEVASVRMEAIPQTGKITWARYVGAAVSRISGCRFYTSGNDFCFVGSDRQRDLAKELYSWLHREIESRGKVAGMWRRGEGHDDSNSYVRAFKLGMATAVAEKARDMVTTAPVTTDSIALERKDKLKVAADRLVPKLHKAKQSGFTNQSGFASGQVMGQSIELRKSMSGGVKRLKA